jgi:hypothetical protein
LASKTTPKGSKGLPKGSKLVEKKAVSKPAKKR